MKHPKAKKKAKHPKPRVFEPAAETPDDVEGQAVAIQPDHPPGSITVTFTGDPGDPTGASDPAVICYRGKDFPKGEPITITDARWIRDHGERVRANRHFKVEG